MRHLPTFLLLHLFHLQIIQAAPSQSERISFLESEVEDLKSALSAFESQIVARYGLVRHCEKPIIPNGVASCSKILKPGARCSLMCNAGYIETPGKTSTRCQKGGVWNPEMSCEIPLLLVSGGTVGSSNVGDSGVEVISFYPSTGCDINLPDMPLAGGSHRTLHNLIYVPPSSLLACNGLTNQEEATCDGLDWRNINKTWGHHSYPNEAGHDMMSDIYCNSDYSRRQYKARCDKNAKMERERKKGVYAAQSVNVGETTLIAGGMVFDKKGHEPTKIEKKLSAGILHKYWPKKEDLDKKRAFFCALKVKDRGYLAIGGLSNDGGRNVVENSVQFKSDNIYTGDLKLSKDIAGMNTPRSGHGCTMLPGEDVSILVSGGTKGIGHGEAALNGVEILNGATNDWTDMADMKVGRFGHAVVNVGDKIFAVGGDTKVPSHILDTIEEYDLASNAWRIIQKKLKKPRANFGFTLVPHSLFDGCVINEN